MLIKDPRFKTPAWNATLWRYMTFEKFLDLIMTRTLYFSNIAKLTDQLEVEIPDSNYRLLEEEFMKNAGSESTGFTNFLLFQSDLADRRNSSFVNCWILNPDESYALWKIYLGGAKTGVAVKTNTTALAQSINIDHGEQSQETIYLGKVDYTDFIRKQINISSLITTKSRAYRYENECRLVILKEPEFKTSYNNNDQIINEGIRVNIDADTLIKEIYVSPFGGKMFNKIFKSVIEKIYPTLVERIKFSAIRDS